MKRRPAQWMCNVRAEWTAFYARLGWQGLLLSLTIGVLFWWLMR